MFALFSTAIKHLKIKPYSMILRFKIYFRFPTELNVGEVSAQVFWDMFCSDLRDMLKGSAAEFTSRLYVLYVCNTSCWTGVGWSVSLTLR